MAEGTCLIEFNKRPFVLPVVALSLFWTGLYLFFRFLNASKSPELHCRYISCVHAITVVIMSGWSGFVQGPWPFTDPGGPNTILQFWTCATCLGYFIYDFIWCIYFKTEGPTMFVHHGLSIFGTFLVLYRGMNGTEMMATIFGAELTNPLLQLRWFLRELGYRNTTLTIANDMVFISLFTFLRIFVATLLLYSHWTHPCPDYIARLGGLAIYLVGWIFWVQIMLYAAHKYSSLRYYKYRSTRDSNFVNCIANETTDSSPVHNDVLQCKKYD